MSEKLSLHVEMEIIDGNGSVNVRVKHKGNMYTAITLMGLAINEMADSYKMGIDELAEEILIAANVVCKAKKNMRQNEHTEKEQNDNDNSKDEESRRADSLY